MLFPDRMPEQDYNSDRPGTTPPLVLALILIFAVACGISYFYSTLGDSPMVVDAVRAGERAR